VALDQVAERGRVGELPRVGDADRLFQAGTDNDGGQVEKRSRDGGDRNPRARGDLVRGQGVLAKADARPRAAPARNGHVGQRAAKPRQLPQVAPGPV
jgi:hypothetical protein